MDWPLRVEYRNLMYFIALCHATTNDIFIPYATQKLKVNAFMMVKILFAAVCVRGFETLVYSNNAFITKMF